MTILAVPKVGFSSCDVQISIFTKKSKVANIDYFPLDFISPSNVVGLSTSFTDYSFMVMMTLYEKKLSSVWVVINHQMLISLWNLT